MKKTKHIVLTVGILTLSQMVNAEEFEVGQKNKEFTKSAITIKYGDSISFKNEDEFHHNVFSLSDAAMFDLGSYDKGNAKSFTFEEAGTIDVECAIHPSMKLTVTVE